MVEAFPECLQCPMTVRTVVHQKIKIRWFNGTRVTTGRGIHFQKLLQNLLQMIEHFRSRQGIGTRWPMQVSIVNKTLRSQQISSLEFHIRIPGMAHAVVLETHPCSAPMSMKESRKAKIWSALFQSFKHSMDTMNPCSSVIAESVVPGLLQICLRRTHLASSAPPATNR